MGTNASVMEFAGSFTGAFAGAIFFMFLLTSKKNEEMRNLLTNNQNNQKQLEKDPRYSIAKSMFDQADEIFNEAAINSTAGAIRVASQMREDGEKILKRATELLNEIKADQGSYAPENLKKETPYPTRTYSNQGYGV